VGPATGVMRYKPLSLAEGERALYTTLLVQSENRMLYYIKPISKQPANVGSVLVGLFPDGVFAHRVD
jgi:hypothetical protein